MRFLSFRGYLLLATLSLIVLGLCGTAQARETTMQHAIGTFDVTVTPADPEVVEAEVALARYAFVKAFSGGMTGSSSGQMLAGGIGQARGVYVALERFVGTLDDREGAFLMAHRGDINVEGQTLSITVVPNSGTGDLAGISGEFALTITDGVHQYDLAYRLPDN